MTALEGKRFKKRGDLLRFAAERPGALGGYFLAGVFSRLSKGPLRRSRQLREASVAQWAAQYTGLTETRDLREVATVAAALDHINRSELAQAVDLLSQRVVAIQAAKRKGGSWDKAESLELLPTSGLALAPGGLAALQG